jgi:hypothetical protein
MFLTSQAITDSERGLGQSPPLSRDVSNFGPLHPDPGNHHRCCPSAATSALVRNLHPLPTTEPPLSPTWGAPYSSPGGSPRLILLLKSSSLGHSPFSSSGIQDGWRRTSAERDPDPSIVGDVLVSIFGIIGP